MIRSVRHTGIVVRDLEKTANFYRALGFIDDKN
jgi:catechol 2,3-dioxygenase-like lactoylglutathione lyase family enzyme